MKFIAVKAFDSYVTANIWMGRLQEENIVCHLQDEYSVTINPALSNAVGGIKLCVTPPQLERCMQLIGKFEAENMARCPVCHSTEISLEVKKQDGFFRSLLDALFGRFFTPVYHCHGCGDKFETLQIHQPDPMPLAHE